MANLKDCFDTLSAPNPLGCYHSLEDDLMDGLALNVFDWDAVWQLQELFTPLSEPSSIWI